MLRFALTIAAAVLVAKAVSERQMHAFFHGYISR